MVSSPGCSRIVPEAQKALWSTCIPSTRLLTSFDPLDCSAESSKMLSHSQTQLPGMTCIYYQSWDEIAFFDTGRYVF
jgi:hypothetical protein